jgi:hypothetical protein
MQCRWPPNPLDSTICNRPQTASFTPSAETEARRPGATPIELVGLERLIELMRNKGIGVDKVSDDAGGHQVKAAFFDEYLHPSGSSPFGKNLFSPM